ncbi:peptidoglycan-binding domain-containing protein [Streptomyces sp. NPDC050732]|uniref:peptidoglycan-binding domain-containing protein n=1 Tax=Streptomyces sp. NPDC050732 TaxID=3154632 RepID=UPI00341A879E
MASVVLASGVAFAGTTGFHGAGNPLDDWWDEQIVSALPHNHPTGNVTVMWQHLLWADGYLTWADIDGEFGPDTTAASKRWQGDHGLDADGLIGRNTWKKAAIDSLALGPDSTLVYYGSAEGRQITFKRPADPGHWDMKLGSQWGTLWYDQCTFSVCPAAAR